MACRRAANARVSPVLQRRCESPRYNGMAPGLRLVVILSLLVVGACRNRESPPPGTPASVDLAGISPTGAARQLAMHHKRGEYDAVGRGIVPELRESYVSFIRAVDEVLAANESLRVLMEKRYSGPAIEALSLAPMADNLGVFSRSVSFFSEEYVGSRAYVTLQEGEQVPLIHAEFELLGGRWLFRPAPVPSRAAAEMSRLAAILADLRRGVEAGQTVDRFAAGFESRVPQQIRRIANLEDVKLADGPAQP